MPANLENSAVATGLERSVFIPIPKKGNAKECSNYCTIALIHTLVKSCSKFSKPGFSNMWTVNFLMFIAALSILANIWQQPKCSSADEWIKKGLRYICVHTYIYINICTHTMQFNSSIKNKIMQFALLWTDLENVMVSEINQRKIHSVWYHWHVKPKKIKWMYITKCK